MSIESFKAADLLTHYLRLACTRAGVAWNEDNDAEVRSIVNLLTEHVDDAIEDHCDGGCRRLP